MRSMKRLVGTFALTLGLCAPATASAVTANIGEPLPSGPGATGCNQCSDFQGATAPGSASYTVPAALASGPWTVTAWTVKGGVNAGNAALEVWRPTGVAGEFRLIAKTGETLIPAGGAPSVSSSVPVQPADVLGIYTASGNVPIAYAAAPVENQLYQVVGDPAVDDTAGVVGSTFPVSILASYRANIGATLTAPDPPSPPSPPVQAKPTPKCKKKKKHASVAKKKRCKKHKKK
jgi:hypothetical protein